jgi:NADPH-dependent 2,4-dienoyl-CoA reductase/sulfur reductase-like enzyme
MKFVIIGGDAAGMSAASKARRNNPDIDVMVLEKSMDVSYSACGMPYNIADPQREMNDLVVRQASVFREKQGIQLLTEHEVRAIDPKKRVVAGISREPKEFEYDYDQLLIATGATPTIPELPGFDLPGVVVLKNLEDGRKVKRLLETIERKKAIIIGMGYIALEMVEALCVRGIRVNMVKSRSRFLPWMEADMTQVIKTEIEKHGVQLYLGHDVERIEKKGNRLKVFCSDLILEGDMVLVAIGIKPNSLLAAEAGIELSVEDSISVDRTLKTSDERIYAAGDCADAYHVVSDQKTWIPLALRANRAGWAVADNVCGRSVQLQGVVGTAVFRVFNLEVARTGLNTQEARAAGFDPAGATIKTRSRAHAHPGSFPIWTHMVGDKKSGRLLGVQMVGREGVAHRINAPAVALHNQMSVEQFGQSDLAYAPPFGPTWDPMLTAANQLLKKLQK